ncbi:serine hydrolase domain-containing protein [Paenibacillus sp. MMS20-IR301]|uniref:serine hydrolase domain-containing protein n=1 Tax=Paenibacillus sp. MMS20-IR301 TaxID=2895946 RepID=UPI0028E509B6|nr:serine hydrolase domain-containing protein [Paenibacillus sp. MMS20-IR301]WNS44728.1 serine hydrolase domain-containing protein [Paenibacillus sp. MMS20-IR301]
MNKIPKRRGTITKAIAILLIAIITTIVCWHELGTLITSGNYDSEPNMVETIMAKTATPGVAVVTSKQGKSEFKTYGYADAKQEKLVTEESLFELGSTTKAFTALAVILLQEEGGLAYSDYISEHLPWFAPTYKGEKAEISINQLLAHTSGIPSWSIRLIPEGSSTEMLATTIHKFSDIALDTDPGTAYQYATVNYDILAMIIEQVTGMRYQDYVTEHILLPLGMTDSYFSSGQEEQPEQLAQGYRVFFGKSVAYNAPRYYGNMAAGYLVTNIKDLEHWINAQLGIGEIPEDLRNAIQQSHEVDIRTAGVEAKNQFYAFGWSQDLDGQVISHSGRNPNYSSQVIMDKGRQEAVFVLTNLNSTAPSLIAQNMYELMNGKPMHTFKYDDSNIIIDWVASLLVLLSVIGITLKVISLAGGINQHILDEQAKRSNKLRTRATLIVRSLLLLLVLIWPFLINYNYSMISVWLSWSVLLWMGLAVISCVLSMILVRIRR